MMAAPPLLMLSMLTSSGFAFAGASQLHRPDLPAPVGDTIVPTNLTISPNSFPLGGGVAASVAFVGAIPKGAAVICKITSLSGLPLTQHVVRGGYRGPSYAEFTAIVTSATTVSCTPPAVIVPGAASLSIGFNTTEGVAWSAGASIAYETVVDAVIGRRPYLNGETEGTLLVESAAHLRGQTMHLAVALGPPTTFTWPDLSIASLSGSDIVQLPFSSQLKPNVTADMTIVMTVGETVNVTVRRRFIRLSPLPPDSTAVPSALDHTTKGLLVDGEPYLGIGWYVAGPANDEGDVNLFSGLGINQIMPYGLQKKPGESNPTGNVCTANSARVKKKCASVSSCMADACGHAGIAVNTTHLLSYLDAAEAAGVKVLWPMQQFGWTGNPACDPLSPSFDKSRPKSCNYTERISDPEWVAGVTENVSLVMHHPALLGYCASLFITVDGTPSLIPPHPQALTLASVNAIDICDDCCPVNDNFQNVGLQARCVTRKPNSMGHTSF